jgi:hypothetical protein
MIEISLIEDKTNYHKEDLDEMENLFKKNFITHENNELENMFKSNVPQIRIHLRLVHGVLPTVIFKAVGNDMFKTVADEGFLKAFLNPATKETPSLIFHFEGVIKSFEFKIKSKDEEQIKHGSKTVFDRLLSLLNNEQLPTSHKESQFFEYENGEWKRAEKY